MAYVRYYYAGFEGLSLGDLGSPWEVTGGSDGAPQVVATAIGSEFSPYAGSRMAQVNWVQAGAPNNNTRMRYNFPSDWNGADEMFLRFRFRFHSDFTQNPGPDSGVHAFRCYYNGGGSAYLDFFFNQANADPWNTYTCVMDSVAISTGGPTAVTVSPNPFAIGAWHKYEIWLKKSATTQFKAWYDGSIIGAGSGNEAQASGFAWSACPKVPYIDITSNYSTSSPGDDNNHAYIDEFEVFFSAGAGDATTGSMSDATIQAVAAASAQRGLDMGGMSFSRIR